MQTIRTVSLIVINQKRVGNPKTQRRGHQKGKELWIDEDPTQSARSRKCQSQSNSLLILDRIERIKITTIEYQTSRRQY